MTDVPSLERLGCPRLERMQSKLNANRGGGAEVLPPNWIPKLLEMTDKLKTLGDSWRDNVPKGDPSTLAKLPSEKWERL